MQVLLTHNGFLPVQPDDAEELQWQRLAYAGLKLTTGQARAVRSAQSQARLHIQQGFLT